MDSSYQRRIRLLPFFVPMPGLRVSDILTSAIFDGMREFVTQPDVSIARLALSDTVSGFEKHSI